MLKHEAIVVGGGIIGLTTAYYLVNAGYQVQVFDQSEIGTEASWAGGGILSPLAPWDYPDIINDLVSESLKEYPAFIAEISSATGMDVEYLDSGMLVLEDASKLNKAKKWSETYHQRLEILHSHEALRKVDNHVAKSFNHGFYLPDIKQVRNPRLLATLKTYLQNNGVMLHNNQPVGEILHDKNRLTGIKTKVGKYKADVVVVCAGAWTGQFFEFKQTKIEPVLGQMLLYKTEPNVLETIILHQDKYLIPRKDGHILSGSTLEFNGFNKKPDSRFLRQQQAFSEEILPFLRNAEIVTKWCGLRPGTPSGIPYIDKHQEIEGLYINAGHYRYGLTMTHASAKILLECMQIKHERPNLLDAEQYKIKAERPDRDGFENSKRVNG